jgi:hypothetical protein
MSHDEVDYYYIHFAYSEDEHWRTVVNRMVRQHLRECRVKSYSMNYTPLGNLRIRLKPTHYAVFALKWNPNNNSLLDYYVEAVGPAVKR